MCTEASAIAILLLKRLLRESERNPCVVAVAERKLWVSV